MPEGSGGIFAYGVGMGTGDSGAWLEAWFPLAGMRPGAETSAALRELAGRAAPGGARVAALDDGGWGRLRQALPDAELPELPEGSGHRRRLLCVLDEDAAPADALSAYLKLHLLSMRLTPPNSMNLDGVFRVLPILAWTSVGPMPPGRVQEQRLQALRDGLDPTGVWVKALDRFPPMLQYVVPTGVRIADSARVRLGAHLGEGTTVMHAGAVNYNAGSLGASMLEGRVSQGVVLGDGSDLGGGASTMGTLSGGNDLVLSIGERCLVGANAGVGISLGDDCVVEAGLYVTAGQVVEEYDAQGKLLGQRRGLELSGRSGMLLRRDSLGGAVHCRPNPKARLLNPDLHANLGGGDGGRDDGNGAGE